MWHHGPYNGREWLSPTKDSTMRGNDGSGPTCGDQRIRKNGASGGWVAWTRHHVSVHRQSAGRQLADCLQVESERASTANDDHHQHGVVTDVGGGNGVRKLEQNLWCKYAIHPYIYMEKMPDTRKTTLGRTGAWSKKAKKMIWDTIRTYYLKPRCYVLISSTVESTCWRVKNQQINTL